MLHHALGITDARDKELCTAFAQLLRQINNAKAYDSQEEMMQALVKGANDYAFRHHLPVTEQRLLFMYVGACVESYITSQIETHAPCTN
jgi:hypothetical protein